MASHEPGTCPCNRCSAIRADKRTQEAVAAAQQPGPPAPRGPIEWETVHLTRHGSGLANVHRIPVPGGWLYNLTSGERMNTVFVAAGSSVHEDLI